MLGKLLSRKVTRLSLLVTPSDVARVAVVGQLCVQVVERLLQAPVMARVL